MRVETWAFTAWRDTAAKLGLPLRDQMTHTDMALAGRGLLGLSPDGHLLYIYTCHDTAGAVRVLMVSRKR